ncbi:MAG: DUF4112 domain-containing protein [Saprospiraceae bacterium]|nr:DUF4112 domain-containing protein [Saprospiraceae bacterium]
MPEDNHQRTINEDIKWIDVATDWMDNKIRIPGTNIRFGLDFLIGLVPYVGDLASFAISGLLLMGMARHGASGMLILKMMGNVLLDTVIGAIPILGDIFDLQYRANWRNLKLFEEFYEAGEHQGSGCWVVILILIIFTVLFFVMIYFLWGVLREVWNFIIT